MTHFRVKLTVRAENDLIDIWFAVARGSPGEADRFVRRLNDRISSLREYPDRGVARPDIGLDARMLVEGNYLILYRVASRDVDIVRVVHGARDLREILLD